jgi:hypothetical protein
MAASLMPITTATASESWGDMCYDIGFDDGQNGPFDQTDYANCGATENGDKAYYNGFIEGCMSADNTKEVCEQATDAG